MNIIIFGKGGREHALASRFASEKRVEQVFVYPGNPGMLKTEKISILSDLNESQLFDLIKSGKFEMGVVGPEDYMASGFADKIRELGLKLVSPTKSAAMLESSKIFSKKIMQKYQIPTAKAYECYDLATGLSHLESFHDGVVIKLSGLFAGKGVFVANNKTLATDKLKEWESFLSSGYLIEDKLEGFEASMFYLCRGNEFKYLGEAADHKRIYDNDLGPNTGGMGCYSPVAKLSDFDRKNIETKIVIPTLNGLAAENVFFSGILFVGIMMTQNGPMVLEYNVRFGDPETQTFLPLIKEGFLDLFLDFVNDRDFKSVKLKHEGAAVHVVKASRGYPEKPILGDELIFQKKLDRHYYFAGVTSISGALKTSGGRVCGLTAIGENITEARATCYANLDQVCFPFEHYRKDIAEKALE